MWWSDNPAEQTDPDDTEAQQKPQQAASIEISSSEDKPAWKRFCPYVPSLVLFILFAISFGLEFNDSKLSGMWAAFYACSMVVCASIIFKVCCANLFGIGFAGGIAIWAMILIIVSAVDLSKTPKGGQKEGGDSDNATEHTETSYEVAGSSLAFVSALYHACLLFRAYRAK